MVVLARSAFRASGEFAGRNALLPRFIIKRIELGLQILLLILDGANLHLDGFALTTIARRNCVPVANRLTIKKGNRTRIVATSTAERTELGRSERLNTHTGNEN